MNLCSKFAWKTTRGTPTSRGILAVTYKVPHAKEKGEMGAACDSLPHKKANLVSPTMCFRKGILKLNTTQRPVPFIRDWERMR